MSEITIDDHLTNVPAAVRPIVESARDLVRSVAPDAEEVVYPSHRPSSPSTMWKLVRYRVAGANVAGIGAFTAHASLFFYRGRELDDSLGLLKGSGKDSRSVSLRSPADVASAAVEGLVREAFELARRGGSPVSSRR